MSVLEAEAPVETRPQEQPRAPERPSLLGLRYRGGEPRTYTRLTTNYTPHGREVDAGETEEQHKTNDEARRTGALSFVRRSGEYLLNKKEDPDAATERVIGETKDFLRDDLEDWLELQRRLPREEFQRLLNDERHAFYSLYFDKLTKTVKTGSTLREVDDDAVAEYLSSGDNLIKTYEVLKTRLTEEAAWKSLLISMNIDALGPGKVDMSSMTTGQGRILRRLARAVAVWAGEEPGKVYDRSTKTGNGLWTRMSNTRLKLTASLASFSAGGGLVGAGIGFLSAGPPGALIGGVAGGLGPQGVTEIINLFQKGEMITPQENARMLGQLQDALRRDPGQLEYIRTVFKIDPFALRPNGDRVEAVRDIIVEENLDPKRRGMDFKNRARYVMEFQEHILHVPREQRSPTDDIDWLFDGTKSPPLQGSKLDLRVYARMHDQIRNQMGVAKEREVPPGSGIWEPNPAYTLYPPDVSGNIMRYFAIRAEELTADVKRGFENIVESKADAYNQNITRVDDLLRARGPGGAAANRAIEVIHADVGKEEGQGRIDGIIALIQTQETQVSTFNTALAGLDQLRRERRQMAREIRDDAGARTDPLDALNHLLEREVYVRKRADPATGRIDPPDPIHPEFQIQGITVMNIYEQRNAISHAIDQAAEYEFRDQWPIEPGAFIDREPDPADAIYGGDANAFSRALASYHADHDRHLQAVIAYNERREKVREDVRAFKKQLREVDYKDALEAITTQEETLRTLRQSFIDKDTQIRTENRKITRRGGQERMDEDTVINAGRQASADIQAWNGVGGVVLDANALRNETYDELRRRINLAYAAPVAPPRVAPVGWPEAENNNPANAQLLLNAMTNERLDTNARFDFAISRAGWRINEIDLLTLTNDEIRTRMRTRRGRVRRLPAVPGNNQIDALRETARVRNRQRGELMMRFKAEQQQYKASLAKRVAEIQEKGLESPELIAIKRKLENYDECRKEIDDMTDDELRRFINPYTANTRPAEYRQEQQPHTIFFVEAMSHMFADGSDKDAKLTRGRERDIGPRAAFLRNLMVMDEGRFYAELLAYFPTRLTPGALAPMRICAELQGALGLIPGYRKTISKGELGAFLTDYVDNRILMPQVTRFS